MIFLTATPSAETELCMAHNLLKHRHSSPEKNNDMTLAALNRFSSLASGYTAPQVTPSFRHRTDAGAAEISASTRVDISAAAKTLVAQSQASNEEAYVQGQLAAIKAKPAVERTDADTEYLKAHDKRYVEILDKIKAYGLNGTDALSADDMDYLQKASGMVNTMAYLSPGEKSLYDEMIAKGQHEAAHGLLLAGMSRIGMEGRQVTLPNGKTFDPTATEVTAATVRNLFKYMFVDPSGQTDRQFEALAGYLDQRTPQSAQHA